MNNFMKNFLTGKSDLNVQPKKVNEEKTIDKVVSKDDQFDKKTREDLSKPKEKVEDNELINSTIKKANLKSTSTKKTDAKETKNKKIVEDDDDEEVKSSVTNITTNTNSSQLKSNNGILFIEIATTLSKVETFKGEESKEKKIEFLSELFLKILVESQTDLIHLYNFLLSKVGPEYRCPELGVGKESLLKCVAKATGKSDKHVKEQMKEIGDLSIIAAKGKQTMGTVDKFEGFKTKKETKPLTLSEVMTTIYKVAETKGKNSMEDKEANILKLLFASTSEEIKFIVRSLEKGLKIGANFKTIIAALSRAISKFYLNKHKKTLNSKTVDKTLQKCIFQLCDYDIIMKKLLQVINNTKISFDEMLNQCEIVPGIPIKPMLAKPTTGVNMVANRFEGVPFSCEYKYDGFRGQIHYIRDRTKVEAFKDDIIVELNLFKNSQIQIFSRNLENMTEVYPDIVEYFSTFLSESKNTDSCILDCEIVPFDGNTNKILPFHLLTTRSRKNVNKNNITVHVCCFLFDIIMLNNEILMNKTLEERREVLKANFIENEHVKITKYLNSEDPDEVIRFMDESIKAGCEGLIVKALNINSAYQPGERNFNWLKLKKDYLTDSTIGDSLDLIPIGANYGKGKRTGTFGSFLLACYNDDTESYETVSMTGAGLKDEDLKTFHAELSNFIIEKPLSNYKLGEFKEVSVWFEPKLVWEIKTADLSGSPIYTAASDLLNNGKGISLRFPRFIRTRSDKNPDQATTSEEIFKMFNEQAMNEKNIKKYTINEDLSDSEE